MGLRLRVYAPVGELVPGMAYLVRRLLENTSNESFLRAGFLENLPEEQLLMNPLDLLRRKRHATGTGANGNGASFGRVASATRNSADFRNDPLTDFSREEARQSMRRALEDVRARLGGSIPLVIAGRRIETGKTIDSINPSRRDQLVGRVAAARIEDVNAAVRAAKTAFPEWRDTPPTASATARQRRSRNMRAITVHTPVSTEATSVRRTTRRVRTR